MQKPYTLKNEYPYKYINIKWNMFHDAIGVRRRRIVTKAEAWN